MKIDNFLTNFNSGFLVGVCTGMIIHKYFGQHLVPLWVYVLVLIIISFLIWEYRRKKDGKI